MNNKSNQIWPGVLLIVVGVIILLNKLDLIFISWRDAFALILVFMGALFFARAYSTKNEGLVFPGTILFLLGLFYLSRWHLFGYHFAQEISSWPMYLMIVGLAFIVFYFFRMHDWGLLIPGFLLLFLGGAFLLESLDWYLPFQVRHFVERFWPSIFILLGLLVVLSGIRRKQSS